MIKNFEDLFGLIRYSTICIVYDVVLKNFLIKEDSNYYNLYRSRSYGLDRETINFLH